LFQSVIKLDQNEADYADDQVYKKVKTGAIEEILPGIEVGCRTSYYSFVPEKHINEDQ
jgi:hypothetical protein